MSAVLSTPTPTAESELYVLACFAQSLESPLDQSDITADLFAAAGNRSLYHVLRQLHVDAVEIEPRTFGEYLRGCGQFDAAGGSLAVASLFDPISGASFGYHLSQLQRANAATRLDRVKADIDTSLRSGDLSAVATLLNQATAIESGIAIEQLGSDTLATIWEDAEQPIDWLVEGILSADQPTVVGAKMKSLKTTLLTDLAVSLVSGLPWLGRFEIPQTRNVLMLCGEASKKAAARKTRRAAMARNLTRDDCRHLHIETARFPQLAMATDLAKLTESVQRYQIGVVILDPLYMGLAGINTSNLNEVGPAMRGLLDACKPASVIIAHHLKKTASFDDVPELEDLSQAGIAEFAGNFWLMGRLSEYQGDGMHDIAVRYGGRDEQFGLLKLRFDERAWRCEVSNLQDDREHRRQQKDNAKIGKLKAAIAEELRRYPDGQSEARIAIAAGTQAARDIFRTAIDELEEQKSIVCVPDFVAANRQRCKGWRLANPPSTSVDGGVDCALSQGG